MNTTLTKKENELLKMYVESLINNNEEKQRAIENTLYLVHEPELLQLLLLEKKLRKEGLFL